MSPSHIDDELELENWVPKNPVGINKDVFSAHEFLALARDHCPATYAACLIKKLNIGIPIAASIANTATTPTSSSKEMPSFVFSLRAINSRLGLEYLVIRWSQVLYLSMT